MGSPCCGRSRSRGSSADIERIIRSLVTLATMEAAAIETQVTSPLTTVRTCGRGVGRRLRLGLVDRVAHVVERSVHGHHVGRRGQRRRGPVGRPGAGRRSSPADRTRRARRAPPTSAVHQLVMAGKSSSRRSSVSIFESRMPRGAVTPIGTTTTPTDTGPAQAPRPTSSRPATSSNPSPHRDRSKRSLGRRCRPPDAVLVGRAWPGPAVPPQSSTRPTAANLAPDQRPSWFLTTLPSAFRGRPSTTWTTRGRL